MRFPRRQRRTAAIITAELRMAEGVPYLSFPKPLTVEQERLAADWVAACRPSVEDIASEVSRIIGRRAIERYGM